jgi:ABC-type multidrug transport system ATPase subunit
MKNEIVIEDISRSYGEVAALRDISLHIRPGELFGLIGPDGAGKTTLFRILATLLLPEKGKASVCGLDIVRDMVQIRKIAGYMPGRFSLYQDLSVEENLRFFATVFQTTVEKNMDLIRDIYVQIEPFRKRRAGKLSGGMKQKLALCCTLIHRPEVLFLDEPTTGVDPVSRMEFWNMLDQLKTQGMTILVSTPYMDEASRCGRIALMRGGQTLSVGAPLQIRSSYTRPLWAVRSSAMYSLLKDLREFPATLSCYAFGDTHHLALREDALKDKGEEALKGRLIDWLKERRHTDIFLEKIEPGIEDCFMAL